MKKVVLLAVVVGAIAFTSCSKKSDYTCNCSVTFLGQTVEVEEITIKDAKESDAEDACAALEQGLAACTLKEV